MGVSSSHSINDLKDNVLLCQLVGPSGVALEDSFWDELLQFSLTIPDNRLVIYILPKLLEIVSTPPHKVSGVFGVHGLVVCSLQLMYIVD